MSYIQKSHLLSTHIVNLRLRRRFHILSQEVIHMVTLQISLQSHGVAIGRIMRQRIQPDLTRLVRREDDQLIIRIVGHDNLLAPVAQDIPYKAGIPPTHALRAEAPRRHGARAQGQASRSEGGP